ncbi:septum formation family protein [Herbiconiux sp. 11R-BC]|uniref:septum formation family protein n=1 Tax=Herbiconiux sp. 11R-BC TaxID=3111637 RepID=UPI003C11FECB
MTAAPHSSRPAARRAAGLAIAVAAALGLAACTAPSPAAAPSATDPQAGGRGSGPVTTDAAALTVSECFDDTSSANDSPTREVTQVPVVACAQEHDFEVYDDFSLSGDGYPGDAQVSARAEAQCLASFESFVGVAADRSEYAYTYFAPTQASWTEAGDRLVSCLIGMPDGKTTGSLAGVAK